MTKRFCLSILSALLLTTWTAKASAQTVTGGVTAGINFAGASGDFGQNATKGRRTAGVLGVSAAFWVNDLVDVQPEILYSMEGASAKVSAAGVTSTLTSRIDMIRIPVLARIGPRLGLHPSCCYVVAGPAIGIVTRAKQTIPAVGDLDIKDQLKGGDFAIVLGAGFSVDRFTVEGRYTAGLTNLNKDAADVNKTRVFAVLAGAKF